ncbi:hypothetical protein ABLT55_15860 [Acinetobacter junii]|nr:hypothetical protein [Acinetobacter junii]
MRNILLVLSILPSFLITNQAFAIDEKYRHQLEQSGCTQLSELQGCDIRKSKQENIKAGFVENNTQDALEGKRSVESQWIAERTDGKILARIKIDDKERVWVNDCKRPLNTPYEFIL